LKSGKRNDEAIFRREANSGVFQHNLPEAEVPMPPATVRDRPPEKRNSMQEELMSQPDDNHTSAEQRKLQHSLH
jgi:hypothetical protein